MSCPHVLVSRGLKTCCHRCVIECEIVFIRFLLMYENRQINKNVTFICEQFYLKLVREP